MKLVVAARDEVERGVLRRSTTHEQPARQLDPPVLFLGREGATLGKPASSRALNLGCGRPTTRSDRTWAVLAGNDFEVRMSMPRELALGALDRWLIVLESEEVIWTRYLQSLAP